MNRPAIRYWVFALDANGRVESKRPFVLRHEAGALALIWKEGLGLGDRVRMLGVPEAS